MRKYFCGLAMLFFSWGACASSISFLYPEGEHTAIIEDKKDPLKKERLYTGKILEIKNNVLHLDDNLVLGRWGESLSLCNPSYGALTSFDVSKLCPDSYEPTTCVRLGAHLNPIQCGTHTLDKTFILKNGLPWNLSFRLSHDADSLDRYKLVVQSKHPFLKHLKEDSVRLDNPTTGPVVSSIEHPESAIDLCLPFGRDIVTWSQPLFITLGSYPLWPVCLKLEIDYTSFGEKPTTCTVGADGMGQIQCLKYQETQGDEDPSIVAFRAGIPESVFKLKEGTFKPVLDSK